MIPEMPSHIFPRQGNGPHVLDDLKSSHSPLLFLVTFERVVFAESCSNPGASCVRISHFLSTLFFYKYISFSKPPH